MAKIVSSDLAPSEKVRYSFGGVSFELGGSAKASYETSDPSLLTEATVHPWLDVEVDPADVVSGVFREPSVKPEDDALSAQNPDALLVNDPKAVKDFEASKLEDASKPLAVDAGLDQDKKIVESGVAKTLASDGPVDGKKKPTTTSEAK